MLAGALVGLEELVEMRRRPTGHLLEAALDHRGDPRERDRSLQEGPHGDLIGGVQSGMGYLGAKNLGELRTKARYVRVTPAGAKEAAPHDVIEVATRHGG